MSNGGEAPAAQPAGASIGEATTLYQAALSLARGARARRAIQAGVVGMAVWRTSKTLVTKARTKYRDAVLFTVAVPMEDEIYDDLHVWLLAQLPLEKQRALTARSSSRGGGMLAVPEAISEFDDDAPAPPRRSIHLHFDGRTEQTVMIDGHRVNVQVESPDSPGGGRMSEEEMRYLGRRERIIFRASGEPAREAVLAFIQQVIDARKVDDRIPSRLYVGMRWGEWRRRSDLPARPLDTVVLADGQRERIVSDLERFMGDEKLYANIGAPWHRGYIFHGPPGTGKTSLAKGLAEHFELDVHYIPLSDLEEDGHLLQLLNGVSPRSMLVLEDVDIVHAAKSRDDAEHDKGISLSGLLNALDGLATPHGLVTVMTTNDLTVLDPALVRPGRADRIEELGYLDDDQMARLVELITGSPTGAVSVGTLELTHAEIIEAAKPYLDHPEDAGAAIRDAVALARAGMQRA